MRLHRMALLECKNIVILIHITIDTFPIGFYMIEKPTCVLGDVLQQQWVFGQPLHLYWNDVLQL